MLSVAGVRSWLADPPAKPPDAPAPPIRPPAAAARHDREKIVAAFLALLAEKPFERSGLPTSPARPSVSLAQLRGEFSSTLAIVAAHIKAIDRAVLAGTSATWTRSPRASGCSTC